MEQKLTRVCKCENCGNEAEMMVTCSLPGTAEAAPPSEQARKQPEAPHPHRVKGTATCSRCGNEADMWIDL